jgi:hypothetical protein
LSEADEENFEVEGISPERARQVVHAAREWVETKRTRALAAAAQEEAEEDNGAAESGGEELQATSEVSANTNDSAGAEAETTQHVTTGPASEAGNADGAGTK